MGHAVLFIVFRCLLEHHSMFTETPPTKAISIESKHITSFCMTNESWVSSLFSVYKDTINVTPIEVWVKTHIWQAFMDSWVYRRHFLNLFLCVTYQHYKCVCSFRASCLSCKYIYNCQNQYDWSSHGATHIHLVCVLVLIKQFNWELQVDTLLVVTVQRSKQNFQVGSVLHCSYLFQAKVDVSC